jgi:NAD(P)-dependent dehydrogenase (short-subunit alcohol dehydrogenase family)
MKTPPVVVVTGASKGLGAAVARWLGTQGVYVALVARSKNLLDMVANDVVQLGGQAVSLPADVSVAPSCRQVIDKTLTQFHRIDAVVNNAAVVSPLAQIASADVNAWRYAIEVNLLGPFYLTKFALPALKASHGRIINTSSGAAHTPIPGASAYCASKAGLTHLTRILAQEFPEITALSVRPGVVDTDMQFQLRRDGRQSLKPEQFAYYDGLKKNNGLEPPEVPGRSIAWLALRAPRHMTGEFRSYDDPDIAEPARAIFGSRLSLKS